MHIPILRQEWYDQLPEDLAAIFDQCMDEYIEYTRKGYEKKSEEAIQFMKDFGIEVVYYTDETRQEWIDAGKTSWDRLAQEMGGRQVLDGIIQWLEDYRAQR